MIKKKEKVLGMVLKGFPRISETFISNEILLLENRGVAVHIISMRKPREAFTHDSVKKIKATVNYLPENFLPPLGRFLKYNINFYIKNPECYRAALDLCMAHYAKKRKTATFKHLFQAGLICEQMLPGSGIAHLHAHFAHSPTSVAMFTSIMSGIPFSFFGHAKDIYTQKRESLRGKIKRAGFVVTCTEYNRQYLEYVAEGAKTPLFRAYHGIDLSLFSRNQEKIKKINDCFSLLTVARMTHKKGIPTILKSLAILKSQGLEFIYTLIGDGEDKEQIKEDVKKLGLEKQVKLTGTLPHHEVLSHFNTADIFILGCQIAENGDRDGIPNVLVEAMAMGVPVVATNVSALPELVKNNESGLLVKPKDPDAMAEAIKEILYDKDLREKFIQKGLKKVSYDFDNKKNNIELTDIYKKYGLDADRV